MHFSSLDQDPGPNLGQRAGPIVRLPGPRVAGPGPGQDPLPSPGPAVQQNQVKSQTKTSLAKDGEKSLKLKCLTQNEKKTTSHT